MAPPHHGHHGHHGHGHHGGGGRHHGGGRFGGGSSWYGPVVYPYYSPYCDPIYDPYCRPYIEIRGAVIGAATSGMTTEEVLAWCKENDSTLASLPPNYGIFDMINDARLARQGDLEGLWRWCSFRKLHPELDTSKDTTTKTPSPKDNGPTIPSGVTDRLPSPEEVAKRAEEEARGRSPGGGGGGGGTADSGVPPGWTPHQMRETVPWPLEAGPTIAGVPALDYAIGDIGYAAEIKRKEKDCHCRGGASVAGVGCIGAGATVAGGYTRDQPGWRGEAPMGIWMDTGYQTPRTTGWDSQLMSNSLHPEGAIDSLDVLSPLREIG